MMDQQSNVQTSLFYEFSLKEHAPGDHLLRSIDRFVDLTAIRAHLGPFYSTIGHPSIDPELMIHCLTGYCEANAERANAACWLHYGDPIRTPFVRRGSSEPGLSVVLPSRSERRGSKSLDILQEQAWTVPGEDLFRALFEDVLARCMAEGLVGGKAFGAATQVQPKYISPVDPAARWSAADRGKAHFICSANYLVDLDNAIIVDVEPTAPIRQAENKAARGMIERTMSNTGLYPARLVGDTGYGSAKMLGWLVYDQGIEPHIPVFDKSGRRDGTFSRSNFQFDHMKDAYRCPAGNWLH